MNDSSSPPDPLLDPLFARARTIRPDTARAEFAFETRLLAQLREQPAWSAMGPLAWRLLPFFGVVVLGLGWAQLESGNASREAEQAAAIQNPDAVDLFATIQ